MSIIATVDHVSEELEQKILNEVFVKKTEKQSFFKKGSYYSNKNDVTVRPYRMSEDGNRVYLPFRWALDNVPSLSRKERNELTSIQTTFTTQLRSVQKEIKDECVSNLNKKGCVLISLYPGAGKTCLSIFLASRIGLKTLIICHRLVLIEQWKKAIERFIENPSIGIISPSLSEKKMKKEKACDFILVNAQNVKKLGEECFKGVGLVIIDEIHAIMAESLSECLYHVSPRYMIGLSATPNRPDGLDKLLDFYFGEGTKIVRELYHPHIVYKITTDITFEEDSKTQWSGMITSQCLNEKRNELIVDIISHFSERNFLVLCKRVEQARFIHDKLVLKGEGVSLMTEDTNDFNEDHRVIVASLQKCGVGFSHDKLDALIMASDVEEYFIQYLARVMRTEEVKPIVFDIVDKHPSLKKHFSARKQVYMKAGGEIKDFYKEFRDVFKKI
jgi:superfamily II DNA or RNA helicase